MGRKSRRKKAGQSTSKAIEDISPIEPAATPVQLVFFKRTSFHIMLILFLSLIAYSNTFESSFHFDDKPVIVKNPIIKDLGYFAQPSSARDFKGHFEYNTFKNRYIGYLTFALNYRLHGLNVAGYHAVNLFIHICTSILLYFLIMLTFKTPYLCNSAIKDYAGDIALLTALLFACHPLQTQAVTYIWQRVTSLSTMLYLLSLVSYIKWRLHKEQAQRHKGTKADSAKPGSSLARGTAVFYLISLVSAVLAMKTKEIAFMVPVMLMIYEFIFFGGEDKEEGHNRDARSYHNGADSGDVRQKLCLEG